MPYQEWANTRVSGLFCKHLHQAPSDVLYPHCLLQGPRPPPWYNGYVSFTWYLSQCSVHLLLPRYASHIYRAHLQINKSRSIYAFESLLKHLPTHAGPGSFHTCPWLRGQGNALGTDSSSENPQHVVLTHLLPHLGLTSASVYEGRADHLWGSRAFWLHRSVGFFP